MNTEIRIDKKEINEEKTKSQINKNIADNINDKIKQEKIRQQIQEENITKNIVKEDLNQDIKKEEEKPKENIQENKIIHFEKEENNKENKEEELANKKEENIDINNKYEEINNEATENQGKTEVKNIEEEINEENHEENNNKKEEENIDNKEINEENHIENEENEEEQMEGESMEENIEENNEQDIYENEEGEQNENEEEYDEEMQQEEEENNENINEEENEAEQNNEEEIEKEEGDVEEEAPQEENNDNNEVNQTEEIQNEENNEEKENIYEENLEEVKEENNDEQGNVEEEKIEEENMDEKEENELKENDEENNKNEKIQENEEEDEVYLEEKQYDDEWEYSDGSFDENINITENDEAEKEDNSGEIYGEKEDIYQTEETKNIVDINKDETTTEGIGIYEKTLNNEETIPNQEENKREKLEEPNKEETTAEKNISESEEKNLTKEEKENENDEGQEQDEQSKKGNNIDDSKTNINNNDSLTPNQNENNATTPLNTIDQQNIKTQETNKNEIDSTTPPQQINESTPSENKKEEKKRIVEDLGFEILDNYVEDIQPCSTMNSSMDSALPENVLESVNYESYLSELNNSGKKEISHETFCSGFFLASFPKKNGQVIENLSKFPASCGHKDCSELPPMKPEIIYRYPLKDTKELELNNLSATICFPTGIKMCYSETEEPKQVKDYVAQITNQKGERFYMRTFHFFKKMASMDFNKEYEIHPLRYHLSKFADEFIFLKDEQYTQEITENIQKILEFCETLGYRDIVYIPYCLCLISKYPYTVELGKCLETIYRIIGTKPGLLNFEINDLIMYLINSIPIPEKNTKVQFYIPYCNNPKIELQCPKIDDISIMNSNFMGLFKYLSIDNIVLIFRLLLAEKKVLFIHDDYTELTNITNSFISLLYPFQWIHTYIPIMSAQMLKYLETFLPFLSGIHVSLMNLVEKVFKEGEGDDSEETFLIYIKTGEIVLSSSFKKNKNKLSKYIQNNIKPLPFEKDLKKELRIIEAGKKQLKPDFLENKLRDAFINIFVKMFYDYDKYIINLDNDILFNKVLFMKGVSNKEEKTEKFFEEFIDTQLFQQFIQNSANLENSYFKKKITEFNKKENKSISRSENLKNILNTTNKKDITYLAMPYIGLKNTDKNSIETILDSYKVTENETMEMKHKIIENDINIASDKYINSKCFIYLNPEKKEAAKEDGSKNNKREIKSGELTEKQLDQIKDDIKDTVANIFKSQIKKNEIQTLRKKIFKNLETQEGKTFFISLISNNNNKVISLQNNCFVFLEGLIRGILNSALKLEETGQLIEEIVTLIISSKYYENESQVNPNTKGNLTIFEHMQNFLHNYSKIAQKNLWKKWYDLELKRKKGNNSDENPIKEGIILNICKNMIFLEISKSIVKNITEYINKIAFEEGSELYEKIKKQYINLITKAEYISEASVY